MRGNAANPSSMLEKASRFWESRTLLGILVALGAALRIRQYAGNPSFFYEEASLTLSIVRRSFMELLPVLENDQSAPPLFLWLEHLIAITLGHQEFMMRALPAAASVLALPLLAAAARSLLGPRAAPIPVAVLALCGPLIQYATVLKQYSSDVAVSAGLLLLVARGRTLALIAGGVIAMWLSDPAPIVLAGIGVLWLHQILRPRSPADRYAKIAGLLTWVASAILLFLVHARHVAAHPAYQDYWGHAYAPFPPRDAQDWSWYADSVAELLRQAGLPTWPGALALIAGIAALVTWRRWRILALALVPVILAYLLSMASVFPFSDRMLLFLVPSLALLVGAGAMVPIELPWRRSMPFARHRRAAAITLQVAAVASLFVTNVPTSIHLWREPYCKSELRQATRRLREQREPADLVYAGARATQPYEYYALDHPQAPRCFSGKPAELLREIREKGSQRVWLLFLTGSASTERQRNGMLAHMDRIGRCEQQWGRRRTWLYLYRVGKQQ